MTGRNRDREGGREGRREGMKYSATALIVGRNNTKGNEPPVTYISYSPIILYSHPIANKETTTTFVLGQS